MGADKKLIVQKHTAAKKNDVILFIGSIASLKRIIII